MTASSSQPLEEKIKSRVKTAVESTRAYDIHTHLFDPAFEELLLWGIDDLLVYHYLVAEVFRYTDVPYSKFWTLSKIEQADLIWNELFLRHSPVSEACRGVLTTLNLLGLDVKKRDLESVRKWFANWKLNDYLDRCMELGGVRTISMTNSPFDKTERNVWANTFSRDDRFTAALRIDPLILAWTDAAVQLREWGYSVEIELSDNTISEIRRFLSDWTSRIDAKYLMVSLPPEFAFPGPGTDAALIEKAILPHCREHGLPFALMLGVKRAQNESLKLAGDGSGRSDLTALANLCAGAPENRFLATVLSRENQHELAVLGRKFGNLHIFGCWWFMNIPYVVEEMTRMRLELLGLSFTPQHSDARVLDQLIYKWKHSREVIAKVLTEKYIALSETGWEPSLSEIERDVRDLLGGAFERFSRQS
ncbi:MAG: glucuronate isomerase [Verrucomicrobia bacterium]|nr:glucuronate isomerase [Verrucomicrobiota bacterium]